MKFKEIRESLDTLIDWTKISVGEYTFHINDPNDPMKQDIIDVSFEKYKDSDLQTYFSDNNIIEISYSVNNEYFPRYKARSLSGSAINMFGTIVDIIKDFDKNSNVKTYYIEPANRKLHNIYIKILNRNLPNNFEVEDLHGSIILRKH